MFLAITSACSDPALQAVLSVVKRVLSLIQIIGPILSVISLAIHITMLVKNPDDKKRLSKVKNSAIALVALFMVPVIVNAAFGLLDNSTTFSSCWNSSSNISFGGGSYVSPVEESEKSKFYTNPGDYQNGEKKDTSTGTGTGVGTGDRPGVGNDSSNRVVFIGDSRTVQMYVYMSGNGWNGANYSSGGVHVVGNDVYVAEGGKGLTWMQNTGIAAAKPYFGQGTAIVILMGVNDLGNMNKYIEYVNANVSDWKKNGSSLYFVSVNPCSGKYSHMNSNIQKFNTQVKSGLSNEVGWIDTYSRLYQVGFTATDGLHYDKSTYQTIYNYIKSKV